MSKKSFFGIIILSVFLTLSIDILFGRYLSAKISTWPLLNRWKILSPQAPIVITDRQTVRVDGGAEVSTAVQQVQSKISSVMFVSGSTDTEVGAAVNLTSDGSFVTGATTFSGKTSGAYYVVLSDGTQAKISQMTLDPATGLEFFKAALNSVPTAALGSSAALSAGDTIVFVESSPDTFNVRVAAATVSIAQGDSAGQVFQSDFPSRGFNASASTNLISGEAVANTNGEVVGIWNGAKLISSDVLKDAQNIYFNNSQTFARPSFGFSYSIITTTDSALTGLPAGAQVKSVDVAGAAHAAGFAVGDLITQVNGQTITDNSSLEQLLQTFSPGDSVTFSVTRGKSQLTLTLTVGQLK